jgi:hypothetical protein
LKNKISFKFFNLLGNVDAGSFFWPYVQRPRWPQRRLPLRRPLRPTRPQRRPPCFLLFAGEYVHVHRRLLHYFGEE